MQTLGLAAATAVRQQLFLVGGIKGNMSRRPITSTYRLQLRGPKADPNGRAFTFADAAEQVGYLADLGISHLYL